MLMLMLMLMCSILRGKDEALRLPIERARQPASWISESCRYL